MLRWKIACLFFAAFIAVLFCHPAVAEYQPPYDSTAYQNLSTVEREAFDAAMTAGDALSEEGMFREAADAYTYAARISPDGYVPKLALAGAYLELANDTEGSPESDMYLALARLSLDNAGADVLREAAGNYTGLELLAAIRSSQADIFLREGDEESALAAGQEAEAYQAMADAAPDNPGLPLPPVVPLAGLCIAGILAVYRSRDP